MNSAEIEKPVRSRTQGWLHSSSVGLIVAGVLVLGYSISVLLGALVFQEDRKHQFEHDRSQHSAAAPAPTKGSVIGRVDIPRLDLSAMVIEGDDERILQRAVGHIPGTALPGAKGNVALAGHRDSFFRALRNIHVNDTIILATTAGSYQYRVESTEIVTPADTAVLDPTPQPTLTLITCYPFSYLGHAPKRFIVRAVATSTK